MDDQVGDALGHPCVADASLLSNFIHVGKSYLLHRILGRPVRVTPTVLDAEEVALFESTSEMLVEPTSEILKCTFMSKLPGNGHYGKMGSYASSFASCKGELWEPVAPSVEEVKLAARLRDKEITKEARARDPEIRRPRLALSSTAAETAAVAASRRWTFLTEDPASVELVGCLFPSVQIVQTCALLIHAVSNGCVSCAEASDIFNKQMVDGLGLRVTRGSGTKKEQLRLRCHPSGVPRCSWENVSGSDRVTHL